MGAPENLKRGTVELLLLTLLQTEDMYGYQLSQKVDEFSEGLFVLQEASMYVILYRMQEKGYISASQQLVGRRRTRVYYHLEPAGEEYLKQVRKEYFSVTKGVLNVLRKCGEGLAEDERL